MRELNQASLDLIKSFESCRLEVYDDGWGYRTVGWGQRTTAPLGTTITQEQADTAFAMSLEHWCTVVEQTFPDTALTGNEFGALVSLVYNCGIAPLTGHLGQAIHDGDFKRVASQLLLWVHVHSSVVPGLVRRRSAERKLFLTPDEPVSGAV